MYLSPVVGRVGDDECERHRTLNARVHFFDERFELGGHIIHRAVSLGGREGAEEYSGEQWNSGVEGDGWRRERIV